MIVKELIELLEDYGDHLEVYFGDDSYWYTINLNSEVVNGVTSVVIEADEQVDEDSD